MKLNKYLFNTVNNKELGRGQWSIVWLKHGQPCLHQLHVLSTVFSWWPLSSFSLWSVKMAELLAWITYPDMDHPKKCNTPDPLHGSVGTPTVWATIVDAILSPRAHIAEAGGPLKKWTKRWWFNGFLVVQIGWVQYYLSTTYTAVCRISYLQLFTSNCLKAWAWLVFFLFSKNSCTVMHL